MSGSGLAGAALGAAAASDRACSRELSDTAPLVEADRDRGGAASRGRREVAAAGLEPCSKATSGSGHQAGRAMLVAMRGQGQESR